MNLLYLLILSAIDDSHISSSEILKISRSSLSEILLTLGIHAVESAMRVLIVKDRVDSCYIRRERIAGPSLP